MYFASVTCCDLLQIICWHFLEECFLAFLLIGRWYTVKKERERKGERKKGSMHYVAL